MEVTETREHDTVRGQEKTVNTHESSFIYFRDSTLFYEVCVD